MIKPLATLLYDTHFSRIKLTFLHLNHDTVLFDLILYVLVNNYLQLCGDGSSWVEPVLSKDKCVLLKDTMQ